MSELSLAIVSVPASDQDRALHFYQRKLGFQVVADARFERSPGEQARWVQLRAPHGPDGHEPSITLVTWFPTMPPGCMKGLVLQTPDLEQAIADLEERGVRFDQDPIDAPWARFTSFDDPDGNGWVLQQPRSLPSLP